MIAANESNQRVLAVTRTTDPQLTPKVSNLPLPPALSDVLDPMSLVYSSDESDSVRVVRVWDEGSQPHLADVMVQGVLAQGIIDSGADM